MAKPAYPTGVENHGGKLRICFHYKGKRVRENLGCLTPLKIAKLQVSYRRLSVF